MAPDRERPMRVIPLAAALILALALLAGPVPAKPGTTLADAQRLAREGETEDALKTLAVLVTAEPGNVAAWRLLQDLRGALDGIQAGAHPDGTPETPTLVRRGLEARRLAPKEAAAALGTLLRDEAASPLFRLDLARALAAAGRASQAESELTRYIKEHPQDPEAHVLLGNSLRSRGKKTAARGAYEKALACTPGLAEPAVALARLLRDAKKGKAARALLEDARERYPRNPTLALGLADDQLRMGEAEAAVKTLRGAIDRKLAVGAGAVHMRLSQAYRLLGKLPETEASARKALEADPDCVPALRALGFVKQKKQDYDGALAEYEKVIQLRPDWPQGYVDVGFAKTRKEDRRGARKALEKALKLDKNHLDANLKMGIYYYLGENARKAKKHLEFVLKNDAECMPANRYLGYVLLAEGNPKKAMKYFERVSDGMPEDSNAMRMVGRALLEMGKLDKAVDAFRDAIGRDGKNAFAYFDLGKGLEKQEKFEDAEAAYRKSIALDAKLTHPNLYLAELVDEVRDEPDKALEFYKRYLELGGHDEGDTVKRRIEEIEKNSAKKKK